MHLVVFASLVRVWHLFYAADITLRVAQPLAPEGMCNPSPPPKKKTTALVPVDTAVRYHVTVGCVGERTWCLFFPAFNAAAVAALHCAVLCCCVDLQCSGHSLTKAAKRGWGLFCGCVMDVCV